MLQIVLLLVVFVVAIVVIGRVYDRAGRSPFRRSDPSSCPTCEGAGAIRRLSVLEPCPDCRGTGLRGVGSGSSGA